MVNVNLPPIEESKVDFTVAFNGVDEQNTREITIREITLGESLLTPGLQTSVLVNSFLHASPDGEGKTGPPKNYDDFKNKLMEIKLERKLLDFFGMDTKLDVSQRIYRVDQRKLLNNSNEQFRVHACDDSLLNDARSLVSKPWPCTSPSDVVSQVLRSCAGVRNLDVEPSTPIRDYIAENIHPFQVINQQADVALAGGDDPSFLHYMTYEGFVGGQPIGTHHFRSLRSLTAGDNGVARFFFQETGLNSGFNHPESIITYNFLCDFDYLSDILNGLDIDGKLMSSLVTINPMLKQQSLLGNKAVGCGVGGGQYMTAFSNFNSAGEQDSCNTDVEKHLLLRQARMSLLEEDKLALRITVPFNPVLHAGKMIEVYIINKSTGKYDNYGTGLYLIHSMTHNVKMGGYGVTTMDCVAQSVGGGIQ
jgi:hypothetical protein